MKISLNTIKQYIDVELPSIDDLVQIINGQLGAIEEIVDLGEKYKDATVVRVVSCEKHPNADKLSVCLVDDGGVREGVERGEGGFVQVVCGAPNVHANMWAIWLPPASVVPSTHGADDEFILSARELRGVMSNGMLAAGDELAINSDHDGIIEITERDLPVGKTLHTGVSFAELFGLNDTIIDIENKMFTHRPDLFGQLGVAREISGILHQPFKSPDWYANLPEFSGAGNLELEVFNHTPENAPRFMMVAMKDVTVGPSPLWLQCELVRWGGKAINNVVDLTNYIMLLTAQPTHAYDYDKIRGHKLGVRMAMQGETVELLNGRTYELSEDDIVVADGEGVIGLAGIMGGNNSEVSGDTKNIVLEVATFDMYAVRKSSMRHGLFTDALTRFNKGQSKLQNDRVLAKLMALMVEYAGAVQASGVFDKNGRTEDGGTNSLHGTQTVNVHFINERLGLGLSTDEIGDILRSTNFTVIEANDDLNITAPFWRTDIELPEDIVEEVGRLYGFDKLPRELPSRSILPSAKNQYRELYLLIRQALSRAGANEVLTYSFVHERIIKAARQDVEDAYKITNALSPDLQYYRLSLTPSLLDKVHLNVKAGFDGFALYEIGRSHSKKVGLDKEGLPFEPRRMALTYAAKQGEGAAYYKVKTILEFLAHQLGLELEYRPFPSESPLAIMRPFEPQRSARVLDKASGQAIGVIGEYDLGVQKAFKLPQSSAGFELMVEGVILAQQQAGNRYAPLSKYPSLERDLSLQVNAESAYGSVIEVIQGALAGMTYRYTIAPLDIYQGDDMSVKHVTVRLTFSSEDKTLSSDEIVEVMATIEKAASEELDAKVL